MLEKKAILNKLKDVKARKIFVQIPEGLKTRALEISGFLDKEGFETVTCVEPCFGACDLRDSEAKRLGCDALLHIGHTDFGLKTALPVVYEEWQLDFDPVTLLKNNFSKIDGYKRMGLLATVQYLGSAKKAVNFLENKGKKVFGTSGRLKEGQVLGCDYSNVKSIEGKVDCFLFIGSGTFHSLGFVQNTEKPVFFIDAENNSLTEITNDRDRQEVKRQLRIEKARGLQNFGIFVSTKPGQMNMKTAGDMRESLQKKGKDAFIIAADMLTPEKLLGMKIEVLVNTACPRIYDDQELFRIPILNPADVKEL